jgi:hypothetical protein
MEEANKIGRPPEIEVLAYNIKEDFEQASVGIVESKGRHGRIRQPITVGSTSYWRAKGSSSSATRRGTTRSCRLERMMW